MNEYVFEFRVERRGEAFDVTVLSSDEKAARYKLKHVLSLGFEVFCTKLTSVEEVA